MNKNSWYKLFNNKTFKYNVKSKKTLLRPYKLAKVIFSNLTKKKFTNEFDLLINNKKRNHEQLFQIQDHIKYFQNNQSPYDLCVKRINELI